MAKLYFAIIFFASVTLSYADISKIRVYPSGIKVSFDAPEYVEEKSKKKVRWAWQKKKEDDTPPAMVSYKKFIRVMNSLILDEEQTLRVNFYNKENKIIRSQTVTNSTKPTPRFSFFIDRETGRKFNGMLDVYSIPEDADYIQIQVYDKSDDIINTLSHPDMTDGNKILVENFNKISPKQKIMFQIEALGKVDKTLTRLGSFYFVN